MNRTHRVVWSPALGAFVVTHEHAKTAGKSCRVLRGAIALAISSLTSEMAVAACSPGIVASGDGSSHVVNAGHICNVPIGVLVTQATVASGLTNTGSIQAGSAITIAGSTLGNILNSGTVHGQFGALTAYSSNLTGSFKNRGKITVSTSAAGAVYFASGSHLAAGIVNNGLIESSEGAAIHLRDSGVGANGIANVHGTLNAFTGISLTSSSVAGGIRNSGVIAGTSRGISLLNADVSGDIKNSGSITGSSAIAIIDSRVTGSLINFGHGLITGISPSRNAIEINHSSISGALLNKGSIVSDDNAIVLNNSTLAGGLVNQGQISGDLGGLLVNGSRVKLGITNSGTLAAANNNGIQISSSSITGGISNLGGSVSGKTALAISASHVEGGLRNSGQLEGSYQGLLLDRSTVNGGIVNDGSIVGASGYGVDITDNAYVFGGGLVNHGLINGGLGGVRIYNTTLDGGFLNTGTIVGEHALDIYNSTVIGSLSNTGTLSAATQGLTISDSLVYGNLINQGELSGANSALSFINSTLAGRLVNLNGIASDATALNIQSSTIRGGLQNDGQITGVNQALKISDSTLTGGLRNTGTLSASDFTGQGLNINHSTIIGGISNSGSISAPGLAVRIDSSLIDGDFKNTGTVGGGTDGVSISGSTMTGSFINAGQMETESNGVTLISDSIAGDIRNSGTITGEGPLSLIDTHVAGSFINTGLMHSSSYGITLTDSQLNGGFTNSGSLKLAAGVELRGSSLGNFVNTGSLVSSSSAYALQLHSSTIIGGLTNSGTLSGILVDSTSRLDNVLITGNNSARFTGTVEAPDTHVSVAQDATFTLQNGNLFHVADFTAKGTLGVAPGSATIAGNYTQASDATLVTHVADDRSYGKLVVTGTASLADQAKIYVDVSNASHAFTSASLNNVISAGTLQSNGTFDVTSNSRLFQFAGVKDANTVDLAISAKASDGVSSAVQRASLGAARVLDAQFASASTSTLTPYFVGATSTRQVASAVAQTLPLSSTLHTSQTTVANINDVVQSRSDATTGMASGDGFYGDNTLWMKPFGSWVDQNGRHGATGYNANIWGMVFGADGAMSERTRLGVSFAYAKANTDSDNQAARQSADIDLYQLTGYGSYSVAPDTELSFHAGLGQNHNDGRRDIDLGSSNGSAKANFDSLTASTGVALARVFTLDETTRFTPSVRADYTWVRDEGYREKGSAAVAPLLLDVDARKTDQLILGLDGKLSHDILPGTRITANLGVGYDVLHENDSITSSYAGASDQSFTTRGLDPSPWLARGGVGLATKIANGAEISVNYDLETRSDFNEQTASLKLSVPF